MKPSDIVSIYYFRSQTRKERPPIVYVKIRKEPATSYSSLDPKLVLIICPNLPGKIQKLRRDVEKDVRIEQIEREKRLNDLKASRGS